MLVDLDDKLNDIDSLLYGIQNRPFRYQTSCDMSFAEVGGDVPIFVGTHLVAKVLAFNSKAYYADFDAFMPTKPSIAQCESVDNCLAYIANELLREDNEFIIHADEMHRPGIARFSVGNVVIGETSCLHNSKIRFSSRYGEYKDYPSFNSVSEASSWLSDRLNQSEFTEKELMHVNPFYLSESKQSENPAFHFMD